MKLVRTVAAAQLALLLAFFACSPSPADAQNFWTTPGGSGVNGAVGMCLTAANKAVPCSDPSALPSPVSGSFSATLSGFTPGGVFATLTATASSASVALPAGTTVALQNTGTTTVSCTLGVGSATATANQIQVPAGSTAFVTPGSNTFGACIDQTGSASNLVVLAGGAGLGTGFGGGGSGGGGGGGLSVTDQAAWTQGSSAFTPNGGIFNDSATLSSGQQGTQRYTTKRAGIVDVDSSGSQLHSDLTSPIPAGTNVIGKVGIDQTTPGTTNAVVSTNWPTTVDTNSGNKSASTPRVVLATDQPNLTNPLNTRGGYGAAQLSTAVISISSSGNNIAVTRAVGTIKVYELELSCASQLTTIIPQDGTSTSLGAKSATQYIFEALQTEPLYTTTGTNNFVINLSGAVTCTGFAKYLDN